MFFLTEYTATLNKNSSRNIVEANEPLNPRLRTPHKALYLSCNSITSIFARRIPWTEEPGRLQSGGWGGVGVTKSQTRLSD